jgi:AFG3 family protein
MFVYHKIIYAHVHILNYYLKVTIVPRGSGVLGFAQYLPKEVSLLTPDQILHRMCMALAGRASEQINFNKVTNGASSDLVEVTRIAYSMVRLYGMSDKIGQVAFPKEQQDKLYSDATAQVMDEEVRLIVADAYQRALDLVTLRQTEVSTYTYIYIFIHAFMHAYIFKLSLMVL